MPDPRNLGVLIRQLQALLGGRRVLSGGVLSAGGVNYGEGFTANRTGTGVYVVTFDVPFASTYTLSFGSEQGVPLLIYYSSKALSGFTVEVENTSGVNVDAFWMFQAIG
jgi:hypothetical protein